MGTTNTDKKYFAFLYKEAIDEALYEWWEKIKNNPSERAILRRCSSPQEVAFLPSYIRLLSVLNRQGLPGFSHDADDEQLSVAAVAGLLAHVRENTGVVPPGCRSNSNAEQPQEEEQTQEEEQYETPESSDTYEQSSRAFGQKIGIDASGKAIVSELRFRRLLQNDDTEARYRAMIRVLRMCNYTVPLLSFAATMLRWDENNTRQQLAFGYYRYSDTNND